FPHRPDAWAVLLALHIGLAALVWPVGFVRRGIDAMPRGGRNALRAIMDWAPLLLIPLLYKELAVLNRAIFDGAYFDDTVIRWEQIIFGGQPSSEWADALPFIALSEPLHAAYLSYYLIIFVPPLLL